MHVLLIGPLPPPINGCSYANQILLKNFEERNISRRFINTNTDLISGKQGSEFSIYKALFFVKTYLEIYKIFRSTVVYITPGQTFFGILKYAPFIFFCKILRKPYVIHVHGNYLGNEYESLTGVKKKIFKSLISGASAGIVLSRSLSKNFEKLLPLFKIHIVKNFVDSSLLMLPIQKIDSELRILYLSNLMREKGILELLDGLIKLKKRNVRFKVTIAGAMEKGIQNEIYERFEKLKEELKYVGTVTGLDKRNALSDANVFVLPTYYKMEGQPICLLEAMATGNIIVTTAHAGIPDVVNHKNGFLIGLKSCDDIADSLQSISLHLSTMIERFSVYNMNYATEKFTEKMFTDNILNILHGVSKT